MGRILSTIRTLLGLAQWYQCWLGLFWKSKKALEGSSYSSKKNSNIDSHSLPESFSYTLSYLSHLCTLKISVLCKSSWNPSSQNTSHSTLPQSRSKGSKHSFLPAHATLSFFARVSVKMNLSVDPLRPSSQATFPSIPSLWPRLKWKTLDMRRPWRCFMKWRWIGFWSNVWKWIFFNIIRVGFRDDSIRWFWSFLSLGSLWTFLWERLLRYTKLRLRIKVRLLFSFEFRFFFSFLNLCRLEFRFSRKSLLIDHFTKCLRNQRHYLISRLFGCLFCFRLKI